MLTDQEKKQILDNYIGIVHDISNKEYQIRVWIEQRGPECDSFEDAVCDFFSMGNYIMDNPIEYGLADAQHKILQLLRYQLREFLADNYWFPFLIETPEWKQIINTAKEVLEMFDYRK